MPDSIERTIYKLEIDDSGYIRGVDSMASSTARLTEQQQKTNQTLQTNQAALRNASEVLKRAKQDLDAYTGTNDRYRQQLQKDFENAQAEQKKLTDLVAGNQKAYDEASKAAQKFADISARASELQQQTTGGKIVPGPVFTPQANIPQIPTDLSGLQETLSQTTNEFKQLADAIAFAEKQMESLDSQSEEFKLLAPIVAQGKQVLEQYGQSVQKADQKHVSLRTQILNINNELARLEETGQGATKQYIALEKEAARLTQIYTEQRERIRILASDTRAFDFGKAAVEAAVSSYQVLQSVQILMGDSSEKLQKETLQLFAAMQLLTGLEQLANQVKRGGVIATNLQSAAQATYTAVVGASTGALRAFRLALLGTGIAAVVVGIGLLVAKYSSLREESKKAAEQQKLFNDVLDEAAKSSAEDIARLELIRTKLNDTNTSEKQRIEIIKDYNKIADDKNKIDIKQVDNLTLINQKLDDQKNKLLEVAVATAATSKATEAAEPFVAASLKFKQAAQNFGISEDALQSFIKFNNQLRDFYDVSEVRGAKSIAQREKDNEALKRFTAQTGISQQKFAEFTNLLEQKNKTKANLDSVINSLNSLVNIDDIVKPTKTPGGPSEIDNVFEQERQALITKLAALRASEALDIDRINEEFAQKLIAEQLRIAKLVKDKKITVDQEKVLLKLAVEVNNEELDKAIAEVKKKVEEARKKLNDELRSLQDKSTLDSINLVQDEFDRRKALIDFNQQKELEDSRAATQERLDDLDEERRLKLISEDDYQRARQILVATGEQQVNNIIQKFSQERQDLSADVFKKTLDAYEKAVENIGFIEDRRQSEEVQNEANRFLRGEINYEQFQKKLDEINKRHLSQRNKDSIAELEKELRAINARLAIIDVKRPTAQFTAETGGTTQTPKADTTKEVEDLIDRQKKVSAAISSLKKTDSEADAKNTNDAAAKRTKNVEGYVSAIGQLADSVISFWQKANEAEQKALERSIEIQQRRVDEAQRIAEHGNAQYLKEETDRLKELQVARENAARRQLAIDAALQASQILVAITGAISKIATPGIGVAETISEIAIIVGALATGYGLVKSLQGNQPKLRKGDPYVTRDGHPAGVDTIPAWLTEGEAVIPVEKNRKYKKAVEAIYHEKIPADVLNEFVSNYAVNKPSKTTTDKQSTKNTFSENLYQSLTQKNINKTDSDSIINRIAKDFIDEKQFKSVEENNIVVNRSISNTDNNAVSNKSISNVETFNRFVENVKQVPQKILNSFVNNYQSIKRTEEFNKLFNTAAINRNEIVKHEVVHKNVIDSSQIKNLTEFINTYHTVKPIPQPNYEKIKQVNEIKISHDSRVAQVMQEHSKKLDENNDLQKQMLRALKTMGINVNMDRDGIAISVMEATEQIKKNKTL